MELRLNSMPAAGIAGLGQAAQKRALAGGTVTDSFKTALQEVSKAQGEASRLQTQVLLGNPAVSLEETMLAMQKSSIGFQATLHVRNRMVQAYTDIMNMSV